MSALIGLFVSYFPSLTSVELFVCLWLLSWLFRICDILLLCRKQFIFFCGNASAVLWIKITFVCCLLFENIYFSYSWAIQFHSCAQNPFDFPQWGPRAVSLQVSGMLWKVTNCSRWQLRAIVPRRQHCTNTIDLHFFLCVDYKNTMLSAGCLKITGRWLKKK